MIRKEDVGVRNLEIREEGGGRRARWKE